MAKYILVREPESEEFVREIRIIRTTAIGQATLDRLLSKGWERVGEIETIDNISLEGLRHGLSAVPTRKALKACEFFRQIAILAEDGEENFVL